MPPLCATGPMPIAWARAKKIARLPVNSMSPRCRRVIPVMAPRRWVAGSWPSPSTARHPAEAAKLALWLASKEQQKARAINLSLLPTNATLYDDPDVAKASPFMPKLKRVFISAVARPSTASAPKYNEVSTIFFQAVSSVLTKKSNGTDAVANLELDLKDKLGYETGAP